MVEDEFGTFPEVVRTNVSFYKYDNEISKLKRKLGVNNMAIKFVNRPSRLGSAKVLAEDAIKRETSIIEIMGEREDVAV